MLISAALAFVAHKRKEFIPRALLNNILCRVVLDEEMRGRGYCNSIIIVMTLLMIYIFEFQPLLL